jgi:SAM-dependent methyltransferase
MFGEMGQTADAPGATGADDQPMTSAEPRPDRPSATELMLRGLDRQAAAVALQHPRRTGAEIRDPAQEATVSVTSPAAPTLADYTAIKARQQATWSAGNYAVIGTSLQLAGESLCEAVDLEAGEVVLDVAAGNGNASLAAARRGGAVTAADYVGTLLDGTRARAAAEGVVVDCQEADAEALPFADASFDVVLSTFGVMFTPNQEQAAAELVRVCRPGGRIGLANWTPEGFIGQMFKIVGRHVPPPAGIRSPLQWGTDERLA